VRTGIGAAEALRIVLENAPALPAERVPAARALGRILCEPIRAGRDLPPADNSAMDGYAVRRADLLGAAPERPVELALAFEVAAGALAARALRAGEAARILTGAPIPPGADAVVRQEDVERVGEGLRLRAAPGPGENVRPAGEDVRAGEEVLAAGTRLGPAELGMLAALGRSQVAVHQRPRVALLSSGDELVEPDGDLRGGRIASSNSSSLAAQCRELGLEPVYLGIARDTPEDLERIFRAGLSADLVVSSAGVSVGDRDYVRGVLEKLGASLLFFGVQIKPGYPLVFARLPREAGPLFFGLPGNPVSAMVTFEEFVRPALRQMMGHRALFRPTLRARLAERLAKPAGRLHFVRVRLERRGGEIVAFATGNQSSGVLRSLTRAQGLLLFPAEETELAPGASAAVQVLDPDFLAAEEPGF